MPGFFSLLPPLHLNSFSVQNRHLTLLRLALLRHLPQYFLQALHALEISLADQLSPSAVGNPFALTA